MLLDHYATLKSRAWERCSALMGMKSSMTGWPQAPSPTTRGKSTKLDVATISRKLWQARQLSMYSSSTYAGLDGLTLWYLCAPQGSPVILNSVGQLAKGNKVSFF